MKRLKYLTLQILAVIASVCIYSSCSGDDYMDAIPANSNALIAINAKAMQEQAGVKDNNIAASLLKVDNIDDCGIDFSQKIYLFETVDGNLGMCAKVNSESRITDWLGDLAKKGECSKTTERRDNTFALLHGSWAVGYSGKSIVIIGPVLPSGQAEAIRTLDRYLKQDEDDGIKSSPLFDKVEEINSPIAIAAQVDALPEKLSAPFTIGAPKGADASQICIAASVTTNGNGCLNISGEPFSFNSDIDKSLKQADAKFRKIGGRYAANIPGSTLCSIFLNMKGSDFVEMMHNSPSLGVLLAGINTAIDMDNILRSVDGEMAFSVKAFSDKDIKMCMAAQLANTTFLKDVDYWKKSCQPGCSITNCGSDCYTYKSSDTQFRFGVSNGKEFYGSTDVETATAILNPAKEQFPAEVKALITGQRFCMVINVKEILGGNKEMATISDLIAPLFGKVDYIVYNIK